MGKLGIILTVGLLSIAAPLNAQIGNMPKISEESLSVIAGDVFEILAVSELPLPRYSWILTRNRQFLQANQTAVFRKRFLEPGTYTLNAQIQGGAGNVLAHTLSITVTPRSTVHPEEEPKKIDATSLVNTTPFLNSAKRIILHPEKKTVRLEPLRPSLALDLLPSIDTNGDSIPQNDQDTSDTFFQAEGSPLFLWFASPLTEKTFLVHDTLDPGISPHMIDVISLPFAQAQNMLTGEIGILSTPKEDGSTLFAVLFEGDTQPEIPLLTEWDFGDGEKSLVNTSAHTFQKAGIHHVSVHLRNLNTNETFGQAETDVIVSSDTPVFEKTPPPPSPLPPQPEETPQPTAKRSTLLVSWIATIGGILVGIVILIMALRWILKKIKGGRSTAAIVAQMEEKVLKEKETEKPQSCPIDHPDEENEGSKEAQPSKNIPDEKEETPPSIQDKTVVAFEESTTPSWLKKDDTNTLAGAESLPTAVVPPWLGGTPKPAPASLAPAPPLPAAAPQPIPPPVPPLIKPTPPTPSKPTDAPIAFVKIDSIQPKKSPEPIKPPVPPPPPKTD